MIAYLDPSNFSQNLFSSISILWFILTFVTLGVGIACIFIAVSKKKERQKRSIEIANRRKRLYDIDITMIKDYINLPDTYVAINIKATGSDVYRNDIIEVGAIKVINGTAKEQFSQLVRPRDVIPADVVAETGISFVDVKQKPPIENVMPEFVRFIGDSTIIVYNDNYNINFLVANSEVELNNKCIDILKIVKTKFPDMERCRIKDIARQLNVDVPDENRALKNCTAICKCYERLKRL